MPHNVIADCDSGGEPIGRPLINHGGRPLIIAYIRANDEFTSTEIAEHLKEVEGRTNTAVAESTRSIGGLLGRLYRWGAIERLAPVKERGYAYKNYRKTPRFEAVCAEKGIIPPLLTPPYYARGHTDTHTAIVLYLLDQGFNTPPSIYRQYARTCRDMDLTPLRYESVRQRVKRLERQGHIYIHRIYVRPPNHKKGGPPTTMDICIPLHTFEDFYVTEKRGDMT